MTCAYTAGLLEAIFAAKLSAGELSTLLGAEGAFVDLDGDGNRWAPSPKLLYSPEPLAPDAVFAQEHFYLAQGSMDPWGNVASIAYDDHDLLPVSHTDAVGNTTSARVQLPRIVTVAGHGPNLNRNGVRYDALGLVVASASMGKALAGGGVRRRLPRHEHRRGLAKRRPDRRTLNTTSSAFSAWAQEAGHDPDHPTTRDAVQTRTRVRHKDPTTRMAQTYAYSDGLGRIALTKIAGRARRSASNATPTGDLVRDEHGQARLRARQDAGGSVAAASSTTTRATP